MKSYSGDNKVTTKSGTLINVDNKGGMSESKKNRITKKKELLVAHNDEKPKSKVNKVIVCQRNIVAKKLW